MIDLLDQFPRHFHCIENDNDGSAQEISVPGNPRTEELEIEDKNRP